MILYFPWWWWLSQLRILFFLIVFKLTGRNDKYPPSLLLLFLLLLLLLVQPISVLAVALCCCVVVCFVCWNGQRRMWKINSRLNSFPPRLKSQRLFPLLRRPPRPLFCRASLPFFAARPLTEHAEYVQILLVSKGHKIPVGKSKLKNRLYIRYCE